MKKHPIAERIDEFEPKLAKLPNAIRIELESLHADIKACLEAIQDSRRKGGANARGSSGRPVSTPPKSAVPYIERIADGSISAYAASIELRTKHPNSDHKFSAATLKKWAESHKNAIPK